MAINTKKKLPKEDNDSNKEMMKYVRAALAILLLVLLFLAFFFGLWGARRVLFEENKYLTLRKLEVIGTGYWNGREAFLAKMLKLNVGSDNLFKLNYPVLRKRLLDIPSINDARIVRVLPDTLLLHVEERVPRLILANPNSPWVIDENCIAIPKAESMATNQKLPVMTGVKLDLISGGMKLTQLRPAVDLVMMTLRNFPNLQILLRTDTKLIYLIVPHMNVRTRSKQLHYLVKKIKKKLIALGVLRAIAVRIKITCRGVCISVVNALTVLFFFRTLGYFGISLGHKLNVSKALHLGNDLNTKRSAIINKILNYRLWHSLSAAKLVVRVIRIYSISV